MPKNLWLFCNQVGLWVFGGLLNIDAVSAAILGLSVLLVTGVVTWKECLAEGVAWDTLTWFAALIAMAGYLNKYGLISWFSQTVVKVFFSVSICWLIFISHYASPDNWCLTLLPFICSLGWNCECMVFCFRISFIVSLSNQIVLVVWPNQPNTGTFFVFWNMLRLIKLLSNCIWLLDILASSM